MKKLLAALLFFTGCANAAEPQIDHTFGPSCLAFSPDAKRLAVAGSDGVKIYESATGKLLQTRLGSSFQTRCLAWSRNGKTLAVGGTGQINARSELIIYGDGQPEKRLVLSQGSIEALYFAPNGRLWCATTGGGRGALQIRNAVTGELKKTLLRYYSDQVEFKPSADGKVLEFVAIDGDFYVPYFFDMASEKWIEQSKTINRPNSTRVVSQSSAPFRIITESGADYEEFRLQRINPSGKPVDVQSLGNVVGNAEIHYPFIAACIARRFFPGYEDVVRIWKIEAKPLKLREVATLDRSSWPRFLSTTPDGKTGAIQTNRGVLTFDTRNLDKTAFVPQDRVSLIQFPPATLSVAQNGARIFNGSWLDATGKSVFPPQNKNIPMPSRGGAVSPDGKNLVAAFNQGAALFLANDKHLELKHLWGKQNVVFSSDQQTVSRAMWSGDSEKFAFTWSYINSDFSSSIGSDDGFFIGSKGDADVHQVKWDQKSHFWMPFCPDDFAWSPDAKTIFALTTSGSHVIYDSKKREISQISLHRVDVASQEILAAAVHSFPREELKIRTVQQLVLSLDGKTLAIAASMLRNGSFERRLLLFDTTNFKRLTDLPLQPHFAPYKLGRDFAFGSNSEILILRGSKLEKWNWNTRKLVESRLMVPEGKAVSFAQ